MVEVAMELKLLAATPYIEELVATALLTTSTDSAPSRIFARIKKSPEQVKGLLRGLPLQHGSILEHNRICWLFKASDSETLELLLSSRFFTVSRIEEGVWLLSANLRTLVEYLTSGQSAGRDELARTLSALAPIIHGCLEMKTG